jgi:hypothetical protein
MQPSHRPIVSLGRSLHLFVEHEIQNGPHAVPGLVDAFGIVYLTFHLAGTGGCLPCCTSAGQPGSRS